MQSDQNKWLENLNYIENFQQNIMNRNTLPYTENEAYPIMVLCF